MRQPADIVLMFVLNLVLPMVAGYCLRKTGLVSAGLLTRVMLVALVGLGTPLMAVVVWPMRLEPELIWLPVLGVVMNLAGAAVALVRARHRPGDMLARGSYVVATMMANRGVTGRLALVAIIGEPGFALTQIIMLFGPVVLFGVCFPVAKHYHSAHHGRPGGWRQALRQLIDIKQLPLLGIAAGLALNLWGPPRPPWLGTAFELTFPVFFWALILPTGYAIQLRLVRRHLVAGLEISVIRMALVPALIAALAWAIGLEGDLFWAVVVVAASPTAINAVMVAQVHGLNVALAAASFLVTTALFLVAAFPILYGLFALSRGW